MPVETDVKLDIFTKEYKLADNRSIMVWDIKSQGDPNFYFQLRFEPIKNKKINVNEIKANLIAAIKKLSRVNKLDFNKLEFLRYLINLGFNVESTAILERNKEKSSKALFKWDKHKQNIIQEFDKKLFDLFVVDIIKKNNKIYFLSYEIPIDITENNTPLCSISVYSEKKLFEKIYLFPTSPQPLATAISRLKSNPAIHL